MDGRYSVFQDGREVGWVEITQEGLYYRISCRCRPAGREMLRLWMTCGRQETDLGLCVPMGDGFGTEKRVSAKCCGAGTPGFCLRPKDDRLRGNFIPLSPEEPFQYIHRLENAYLEKRNGRLGIRISNM